MYFPRDSVRPCGDTWALEETLRAVDEYPVIARIGIDGHAVDGESAPLKLSARRAEWVRRWFVERGVAAERLETRSFGEERPIAAWDTPEGRAVNRRVEIRVTAVRSPAAP